MTTLPASTNKKLGLVIDLDICVGCHACAVNCKEWNTGGHAAPLTDLDPYGPKPIGVWFNRIHTYEVGASETEPSRTVHFKIMSSLRRCRVRHGLPDRCQL